MKRLRGALVGAAVAMPRPVSDGRDAVDSGGGGGPPAVGSTSPSLSRISAALRPWPGILGTAGDTLAPLGTGPPVFGAGFQSARPLASPVPDGGRPPPSSLPPLGSGFFLPVRLIGSKGKPAGLDRLLLYNNGFLFVQIESIVSSASVTNDSLQGPTRRTQRHSHSLPARTRLTWQPAAQRTGATRPRSLEWQPKATLHTACIRGNKGETRHKPDDAKPQQADRQTRHRPSVSQRTHAPTQPSACIATVPVGNSHTLTLNHHSLTVTSVRNALPPARKVPPPSPDRKAPTSAAAALKRSSSEPPPDFSAATRNARPNRLANSTRIETENGKPRPRLVGLVRAVQLIKRRPKTLHYCDFPFSKLDVQSSFTLTALLLLTFPCSPSSASTRRLSSASAPRRSSLSPDSLGLSSFERSRRHSVRARSTQKKPHGAVGANPASGGSPQPQPRIQQPQFPGHFGNDRFASCSPPPPVFVASRPPDVFARRSRHHSASWSAGHRPDLHSPPRSPVNGAQHCSRLAQSNESAFGPAGNRAPPADRSPLGPTLNRNWPASDPTPCWTQTPVGLAASDLSGAPTPSTPRGLRPNLGLEPYPPERVQYLRPLAPAVPTPPPRAVLGTASLGPPAYFVSPGQVPPIPPARPHGAILRTPCSSHRTAGIPRCRWHSAAARPPVALNTPCGLSLVPPTSPTDESPRASQLVTRPEPRGHMSLGVCPPL
ncbi:hypothetical protein Purlil1_2439 [Purpureocillium lilacinum]|uniref:Uncharacterized protein n=1 Tax=Purpureocillium lilacinum TaxID=33203 RepID=A0ABR0CAQ5_PURLI|nr:hypothetical protein Purlil1_2439 [Purpureocillium lilacinum]